MVAEGALLAYAGTCEKLIEWELRRAGEGIRTGVMNFVKDE